jgi:hypothetical protein
MFTDTTRTVALLTGLVTVTTVKVIVLRLTVNVTDELIGIPFGHKIKLPVSIGLLTTQPRMSGVRFASSSLVRGCHTER